jgi:hypothetical protein
VVFVVVATEGREVGDEIEDDDGEGEGEDEGTAEGENCPLFFRTEGVFTMSAVDVNFRVTLSVVGA